MESGYTRKLVEFAINLTFKDLPPEIISQSKSNVLDTLGVSVAGSGYETGKTISDFVKEMGGSQESTVVYFGYKLPCTSAVLANAFMAHSLELDDIHEGGGHIGAAVVPAALALGEKYALDGASLITAFVAGYEVAARIGCSLRGPFAYARGFHPSSIAAPFGTVVVAGKILGLNEEQMANALGLAGVQASGLMTGFRSGPTSWYLQYGRGAQAGLNAALLAQRGSTGPSSILEDEIGVCRTFSDKPNFDRLTEGLGRDYAVKNIGYKPYPTCGLIHAGIDGVLKLLERHSLKAEEIGEVIYKIPALPLNIVDNPNPPTTRLAAQSSAQYSLALAIIHRQVRIDQFTEEKLRDSKILDMSRRIKVITDGTLDRLFVVELKTKGGDKYTCDIDAPKGTPANPMTTDELRSKFGSLTRSLLGGEKVEGLMKVIENLQELGNVQELSNLLIA